MKHNILPLFYKFNENDIDHYYHYHCDYDNYNYNYHDYTIMNTTIIFVIVIVLALFSLPFFYEVKENQTTERKYKIECIAWHEAERKDCGSWSSSKKEFENCLSRKL